MQGVCRLLVIVSTFCALSPLSVRTVCSQHAERGVRYETVTTGNSKPSFTSGIHVNIAELRNELDIIEKHLHIPL